MSATSLFDIPSDIDKVWKGMPSFSQKDISAFQTVYVHLRSPVDREKFAELIGQKLTPKTRAVWYPREKNADMSNTRFQAEDIRFPKYPVYIISKGRWKSRCTARKLTSMNCPFRIVVEPQEYKKYARVIPAEKVLKLPFSNLGQGSIPARNWVWEHSIKEGYARHWILDDNITQFYRLYNNLKVPVACPNIFRAVEDFSDRYENVALSGMQYEMFAPRKEILPPYYLNTRIYSCILIKNDIPYRWRGKYNEDTDLSIRALKDGWCTVLFYAFLANKIATMRMKGGNTEELYSGDGRLKMAESLREQHPDVTTIMHKWGRWQHHVDYRPFKNNKLKPKHGAVIKEGTDEFGMYLQIDE